MAWAIFSLALWVALPVISNAILYATAAPILIGAFKIKAWAEEVLRRDTWVKQQQRTPHL